MNGRTPADGKALGLKNTEKLNKKTTLFHALMNSGNKLQNMNVHQTISQLFPLNAAKNFNYTN